MIEVKKKFISNSQKERIDAYVSGMSEEELSYMICLIKSDILEKEFIRRENIKNFVSEEFVFE